MSSEQNEKNKMLFLYYEATDPSTSGSANDVWRWILISSGGTQVGASTKDYDSAKDCLDGIKDLANPQVHIHRISREILDPTFWAGPKSGSS